MGTRTLRGRGGTPGGNGAGWSWLTVSRAAWSRTAWEDELLTVTDATFPLGRSSTSSWTIPPRPRRRADSGYVSNSWIRCLKAARYGPNPAGTPPSPPPGPAAVTPAPTEGASIASGPAPRFPPGANSWTAPAASVLNPLGRGAASAVERAPSAEVGAGSSEGAGAGSTPGGGAGTEGRVAMGAAGRTSGRGPLRTAAGGDSARRGADGAAGSPTRMASLSSTMMAEGRDSRETSATAAASARPWRRSEPERLQSGRPPLRTPAMLTRTPPGGRRCR